MNNDCEDTVESILRDTVDDKLKWRLDRNTIYMKSYLAVINLTPEKKLIIELYSFQDRYLSNITFFLVKSGEKVKIKSIGYFAAAVGMYRLLNLLEDKNINGRL